MNRKVFLMLTSLLVLNMLLPLFSTTSAKSKPKTGYVNITSGTLNVRSGAGEKYTKVGSLNNLEKVAVYAETKSGWSEIRYKGKKAFVSSKYISPYKAAKISQKKYKGINDLKYPQVSGLKNKKVEKKLNNAFISHIKQSYKDYLDMEQFKSEFVGEYAEYIYYKTKYTVKYNDGKFLSVLFYDDAAGGGARNHVTLKAYNYNINNGKLITLNSIMTTKAKRMKLVNYMNAYNKKHDRFPGNIDYSMIHDTSEFVYTNGGINLCFQEYTAWASSDMPVIKIPSSVYK